VHLAGSVSRCTRGGPQPSPAARTLGRRYSPHLPGSSWLPMGYLSPCRRPPRITSGGDSPTCPPGVVTSPALPHFLRPSPPVPTPPPLAHTPAHSRTGAIRKLHPQARQQGQGGTGGPPKKGRGPGKQGQALGRAVFFWQAVCALGQALGRAFFGGEKSH
jgi:hypothetical protein